MINAKEAAAISQEIYDKVKRIISDITFKALEAANEGNTSISIYLSKVESKILRMVSHYMKDILGYGVGATINNVYTFYWSGYDEDVDDTADFITANTCFLIAMSVQSTVENLLKIINNEVLFSAENGEHEVIIKIKWYDFETVNAARETLLSLGYNVECSKDCMTVSW